MEKKDRKANTKPHPLKKTGQAERDRERRRQEAFIRQELWSKLTSEQKIAHLDLHGYVATRQRNRITRIKTTAFS